MKGIQWWAVALVALLGWAPQAWAQEEGGDAPQILTSDLARRTEVTVNQMTVDFAIVDTDKVVEVTINGEKQKITPSETLVVRKTFTFTQPVTRIEIAAKDEKGNARTLAYVVTKPGAAPAREEQEAKLRFFDRVALRYEVDTNPSNDLSTPVDLGVDVTGVVPDSEQEDTRLTLRGLVGLAYGNWSVYLGAVDQSYSKSENEQFDSTVLFIGGGWRSARAGQNAFVANLTVMDIDLGDFDYSQQITLTPGYETNGQDAEGKFKSLYALDIISKDFARSSQDAVTQFTLKWDYSDTDAEQEDTFRNLLQVGTASEGIEETEYTFIGLDEDWTNVWGSGSGFRFDVGWGLQYRSYPNDVPLSTDTPLGDTRVDNLLRISIGPGWQFSPTWSAVFGYRYLTNLSNKQPYVRQVYGLIVEGAF